MGITFHRLSRYRHRNIYGGLKAGGQVTSLGYGTFHNIRTYLLSTYNLDLGVAFLKGPCDKTEKESEMLKDISPYIPKPLWALFTCNDTEGEWSNDELVGFIEELRKNKYFVSREGEAPYVPWDEDMPSEQRIPHRDIEGWNGKGNDFLNDKLTIKDVNRFVGHIYQVGVNEGYGLAW